MAEGNRACYNAFQEGMHEAGRLKALRIVRLLGSLPVRRLVADIGCHDGTYTAMYAKVPGILKLEGFDLAEKALEAAKQKGIRAAAWDIGAEKCPAADGSYDVVIAADIIEHLVDTEFFMAEIKRILKSAGHVILTTPNLYYWLNRVRFFFGRAPWCYPGVSANFKVDPHIQTEHIRLNGIKEWSGFFKAHGFEILKVEGMGWALADTWKGKIIHALDQMMPNDARFLTLYLLQKKNEP